MSSMDNRKCINGCLSGYYARWKPCCHACKMNASCKSRCIEAWELCGNNRIVDKANHELEEEC